MHKRKISLAHGSGGKLMHVLIDEVFRKRFKNPVLDEKGDSAILEFPPQGTELAFTTDSYVVNPVFFPGGDIGKLAMCGTINDLAVCGAKPRYMSCGFVIEDGLDFEILERIAASMAEISKAEGILIVTGDVKVVEKEACDKVFINTSGIGLKDRKINFSREKIVPGDKILINGAIGEHGIAVLIARGDFHFSADIVSDCAPLSGLIEEICDFNLKHLESEDGQPIKFMRDPTRGGLATTLHEIVEGMDFGIVMDEGDLPVREEVRAASDILGLDPVYIANEGKVVVLANKDHVEDVLQIMRKHPLGKETRIIGEVVKEPEQKVLMKTRIGGSRIIEMIAGNQLPRIC